MTYEENGPALSGYVSHLAQTLALECGVPHSEDFVHQQDFRVQVGGNGEARRICMPLQ